MTGTSDFPTSYIWLEPEEATGIGGVSGSSGDSDRVIFAWAPAAEVTEPASWTSTITLVGNSPGGFTPPGPVVECVLARPDEQNTTVSMDVVSDPPDPSVEQVVTYTFPNHEFLPGDAVTCELVSLELSPETTTTVPETTTTVPETTTTVPETTVPETTVPETTVPETTVRRPTTAPATTVPGTTVPTTTPPTRPATATEALQAAGDYGTFLSLASGVPSVQALLDGAGPITVFAPNDDAFAGVNPPADPPSSRSCCSRTSSTATALDACPGLQRDEARRGGCLRWDSASRAEPADHRRRDGRAGRPALGQRCLAWHRRIDAVDALIGRSQVRIRCDNVAAVC